MDPAANNATDSYQCHFNLHMDNQLAKHCADFNGLLGVST
jgi:hypothetical protein